MRFLGNIEAKTDAKGRAFLPANFRKILQVSGEEKLVLRKDVFQPCLVIYPESVWNEQLDQLRSKLSRWNAKEQQIYRSFIADAILLTLDGNGRFLIPKRQMKLADIEQNIRVTECAQHLTHSLLLRETAAAAQLLRAAENMVGQLPPNAGTVRRPQEMPAHAVQVRHNQLIW